MSAPEGLPLKLDYRPVFFHLLPYHIPEPFEAGNAQQSFSFLPGYRHISFEEQRLRDMEPPPPMATGNVGTFAPSALKAFVTAYPSHEPSRCHDVDLLEPSLPLATIRVTWQKHETATFAIHKNILEHCSPFFKTLLAPDPDSAGSEIEKGESKPSEATTPLIEFEGSIDAFRLYTEWVYSGLIQKRIRDVEESEVFYNIGQAYLLGDKLQDHKFKNAIVDFLLEVIYTQHWMDLTLPTLIFEESSVTAPLRQLLVDLYVLYGHKDWLKPVGSKVTISATFLSGLSTAFLTLHGYDEPLAADMSIFGACKYHEHPDGNLCSNDSGHPQEIVETEP